MKHRITASFFAATLLISAAAITGCATKSTVTPSMAASTASVTPSQVEGATQLAVSTFLAIEPQYLTDAKLAGAALAALSGTNPGAAQIQTALQKVAPNDAKYAVLVNAVLAIWNSQVSGNSSVQSADQYIAAVAAGINAATGATAELRQSHRYRNVNDLQQFEQRVNEVCRKRMHSTDRPRLSWMRAEGEWRVIHREDRPDVWIRQNIECFESESEPGKPILV